MRVLNLPVADLVMLAIAVSVGIPLIVADVREHRLPNRLTGGAALALIAVAVVDGIAGPGRSRWLPMVLTAAGMAAAGYLLAVVSPSGVGLGDVKLLGVIGLALGHLNPQTLVVWLLALALASAAWLLLASRFDRMADRSVPWRKRHIAFGPPMIVAWWLVYAAVVLAGAPPR
ncbi:prepilin peptidase [Blastococcus sp. Marseille-P5729]|uniref:prepilin peptidase n=1 Tax=Blastococcus sp. Marseille-P5729 TaxID=2086582 RepID=UPI00131A8782|nr:prepilin peptidase [Blastococcus sp. Marseille-P5729]